MANTNERLRDALRARSLTTHDVAAKLGADTKTVQRWITQGRSPQPVFRHQLARLVGQNEAYLWPDIRTAGDRTDVTDSEIVRVYPHRADVPAALWQKLFADATQRIDILVYSGIWLPDQNPRIAADLGSKARAGVAVRILLGDPDSPEVALRGTEEVIGDSLAGKVRNVLVHYADLRRVASTAVRLHTTTLYTSIYRFDDHLLANAHVYGFPAAGAPVIHLRRLNSGVLFDTYAESFEKVWQAARPAWPDGGN